MKRLILCVLLLAGCTSVPTNDSLKVIQLPTMDLNSKSETLKNSAAIITKRSEDFEVKSEAAKVDTVADELKDDHKKYEVLIEKIVELEQEVHERDELLSIQAQEASKIFNNVIQYGLYIGGALMVAGVLATIFGSRIPMLGGVGFSILGSGVAIIAVSYSLMSHAKYVAFLGLVAVIGIIVWAVVRAIKEKDKFQVSEQVQIELVRTIEYLKTHGWDKDEVAKLQSPETQSKIAWIKTHLIKNRSTGYKIPKAPH
jgi:energy-converting hydrogenase Eha subunit E/outer membrane murein-binding lipoprotein Lpp